MGGDGSRHSRTLQGASGVTFHSCLCICIPCFPRSSPCPCCIRAVSVLCPCFPPGQAVQRIFFSPAFSFCSAGKQQRFFLFFSCSPVFSAERKTKSRIRVRSAGRRSRKTQGARRQGARRGRRERFRRPFHDCIFFMKECNVAGEAAGEGRCFSCFFEKGGAVYFFLDKVCEKKTFWRLLEMSAFMFFFCLIRGERKFA